MRRRASWAVLGLAGLVLAAALFGGAQAQGTCGIYKSFATGDSFTASDATSIQTTLGQTNMVVTCMDDYSATAAQMNTATDPNSAGSASLATTLAGELERLRFTLRHVHNWTQWWSHYEDVNFRERTIRNHLGLLTGYKELFRSEAHLSSASTRFHLLTVGLTEYVPGAAHPESVLALFHVNTTVRFKVGIGGDIHVGNTLGIHAGGLSHAPALFNLQFPRTGLFWPARDHLGVTLDNAEIARFHGGGLMLANHAAAALRHAGGSSHVAGLSLGPGSDVQAGDHAVGLWLRGGSVGYRPASGLTAILRFGEGGTIQPQPAELWFASGNNAGAWLDYTRLVLARTDSTAGSEDAHMALRTRVAGTSADRIFLSGTEGGGGAIGLVRHAGALGSVAANTLYADTIVKAWVSFAASTAGAPVQDSFNVAAITDVDTGVWIVTWDLDFTTNAYATVATGFGQGAGLLTVESQATTHAVIRAWTGLGSPGTATDFTNVNVIAIGRQ